MACSLHIMKCEWCSQLWQQAGQALWKYTQGIHSRVPPAHLLSLTLSLPALPCPACLTCDEDLGPWEAVQAPYAGGAH
jgi:hypothetical protein